MKKIRLSTGPAFSIVDAEGFVCTEQLLIYPDGLYQKWVKWDEGQPLISEWRPVPVIPSEMCGKDYDLRSKTRQSQEQLE